MQQKNLVLFILLSMLILLGAMQLQNWLWPKQQQQQQQPQAKPGAKADAEAPKPKPQPAKPIHLPEKPHAVDPGIQLGDESSKIRAVFDPRGAGVRTVTL